MFFDPLYMMIGLIGMALIFIPQMLVKSTFAKFSEIAASTNMTGADIARNILQNNGIAGVAVEPVAGDLTDHYDPSAKIVRLSEKVYYGKSISAYGVAAHEIGHVIQDHRGYLPMKLRAGIFPLAQTGQMLGPILIIAGIALRSALNIQGLTDMIAITGIIFYAGAVLFQIITLPVEFNASSRALQALTAGNYLYQDEVSGARKVLSAAALTYVATALYALMELAYWVITFLNRRD